MFHAFAVAAILVALAELGDKTQLLTLALAARYRTWQVVTGVLSAILALQLIATAAGSLVGELLPGSWLAVLTGALFIGFGIWTIRGDGGAEEMAAARGRYGVVLTVTAAFFIAELGDKTQVLTMAIAADPGAVLRAFGTLGPALEGALGGPGAIGGAGRTGMFVGV
ncbi:MAG: TMEM165/GDT1 family protein [Coriobacteriia bacterium]|nr:TMEM165/GDT1 family protein [Coriobacteriia bacterium]